MQALTIWQPWTWAICHAGKRIENRVWAPPPSMIGRRLAIHAAVKADTLDAFEAVRDNCPEELARSFDSADLPMGSVVAVARLFGIVRSRPGRSSSQVVWWAGLIGWELSDLVVLPTPVPCKGRQKLWELPDEVAAEVDHQCGKADAAVSVYVDDMEASLGRMIM